MAKELCFHENEETRGVVYSIHDDAGNCLAHIQRGRGWQTLNDAKATARVFTASEDLLSACRAYLEGRSRDEVLWLMECAVERAEKETPARQPVPGKGEGE